MSEWSGYLKRAVAHLEQHIDQVLLESQDIDDLKSSKPFARQDKNSKRSEPTANKVEIEGDNQVRQESDQNAASSKPISQKTSGDPKVNFVEVIYKEPPVLAPVVSKAYDLALKLEKSDDEVKDAALDLADALNSADSTMNSFLESINDRIRSLNSKFEYLCADRIEESNDDKEHRIALLLDESQKMSMHELRLQENLRQLQLQNQVLDRKVANFELKEASIRKELADAKANTDTQIARIRQEAQDRLKSYDKEIVRYKDTISTQEADNARLRAELVEQTDIVEYYKSLAESGRSGDAELQVAKISETHATERNRWVETEASLLAQIGELELTISTITEDQKRLQSKYKTSLVDMAVLKADLNVKEAEIEQLRKELRDTQEALTQKVQSSSDAVAPAVYDLPKAPMNEESNLKPTKSLEEESNYGIVDTGVGLNHFDDQKKSEYPHLQMETFLDLSSSESSRSHKELDDAIQVNMGTEMSGSDHLVGRLTRALRRLESELASTKESLKITIADKEAAQNEIINFVDGQDELAALRERHTQLDKRNGELEKELEEVHLKLEKKTEQVEELQADVEDLKSLNRVQTEQLICEIQRLSTEQKK